MKFAYIGIPEAQSFFRLKDNITGFELKFTDVDAARPLGRRVVSELKGFPYRVKDWSELNRNLFSALKLEKLAMAIILTFIVLVACFNILSTLIMLVLEKTKEISILKSMGARDASIMKIFVLEGVTIGAIGTAMGLLMGVATCSFIERYGLRHGNGLEGCQRGAALSQNKVNRKLQCIFDLLASHRQLESGRGQIALDQQIDIAAAQGIVQP